MWRILANSAFRALPKQLSVTAGAICAGAGLAAAVAVADGEEPSFRHRVIGAYEDRIRKFSAPEKVFEMFASVEHADEYLMTPDDFMRAITPYTHRADAVVGTQNFKYDWNAQYIKPTPEQEAQYAELLQRLLKPVQNHTSFVLEPAQLHAILQARSELSITAKVHLGALEAVGWTSLEFEELLERSGAPGPKKSEFMRLVDLNGDGLISYEEFMLFSTLAAIPASKIRIAFQMFDADGSGEIDRDEFQEVLHALRKSTAVGKKEVNHNLIRDKASTANAAIFSRFFGEDGTGVLTEAQLADYVQKLQREVMRLKFVQYDADGSGALDAQEFARFLIADTAGPLRKQLDQRLDVVAAQDLKLSISLDDFMKFYEVLRNLPKLKVAMRLLGGDRGCSRADFELACQAAAGVSVDRRIVHVLYTVFDVDGNGRLDESEFVRVMEQGLSHGVQQRRDLGVIDSMKALVRCIKLEVID